jgi:lauroyl/myristoyl acyltransferase
VMKAERYERKHRAEYALLRSMEGLVNLLPYRGALGIGWCLARLVFEVGHFRVDTVLDRMRSALGESYTDKQRKHMAWISWRNTVFNAVDMLRVRKATPAWVQTHFDCEEYMAAVKAQCDTGRGAVMACPHMGNWELTAIACFRHGIPIFNIAARQRNPLVSAHLDRLRAAPGIETLTRGSASMRTVVSKLKHGQALAILPDSRMRTPGLPVPFLNGTANLGKGMAVFARLADVPIFPGVARREGWAHHTIEAFPPIYPDKELDKEDDIRRMTRLVMEWFDTAVKKTPEQWFWLNKRWVLDPVAIDNEGSKS